MTFPAAIVHAFYYARCIHASARIDFSSFFHFVLHARARGMCTLDEFEYRTSRRELLRPAPPVHRKIPSCSFFSSLFLSLFFYFNTDNGERGLYQQNIKYQCKRLSRYFLLFRIADIFVFYRE